ncbi:hypothetical protein TEA_010198 [Camellia sinensis var. sinensis]|uniref:2-oxo-4-hydroxy-4-carboxy-5-ureidoimidazoline decarboxylase n=1 Tax=Camellia sinensis var. sinensis TaxID=542762 RepID=A0A4S4DUA9_CAMSN|nr:hypothetical protein TEA_010198 [Camellia sinensis var. sinensis]
MEAVEVFGEKDFLACCGSTRFAKEMASAAPFASLQEAVDAATDIWFNKDAILINQFLNFSLQEAHSYISIGLMLVCSSTPIAEAAFEPHVGRWRWSKGEQSTALATATDSTLQELSDWNSQYHEKFGFVFLICASGRSTPEILAELKRRYQNRPLAEFEIAAGEQMKIIELRLAKLFSTKAEGASTTNAQDIATKAGEDRVSIIGAHLTTSSEAPVAKPAGIPVRTRPPITTHVLDVARGSPASGIDVRLEMWRGNQACPTFGENETGNWVFQGSSTTDKDGRSGQLMSIVDALNPGTYRISFNTGKYSPEFVSRISCSNPLSSGVESLATAVAGGYLGSSWLCSWSATMVVKELQELIIIRLAIWLKGWLCWPGLEVVFSSTLSIIYSAQLSSEPAPTQFSRLSLSQLNQFKKSSISSRCSSTALLTTPMVVRESIRRSVSSC